MISPSWQDRTLRVIAILLVVSLLIAGLEFFFSGAHPETREPVPLRILAVNDFHGQLPPGQTLNKRPAGSGPVLASYLETATASAGTMNIILALPGDTVGASPPESGLLLDEPTMLLFNEIANTACGPMWLPGKSACPMVATLGNHEFDKGIGELMRKIYGGNGGTAIPHIINPYPGTEGIYISSNVVWRSNNTPILPPYTIMYVRGIPVAFIGATTQNTPSIQKAENIADVMFLDEADSINRQVSTLRLHGIHAFVILLHEGGNQDFYDGPTRTETNVTGRMIEIVNHLDGDVDVVLSGHTHAFTNAFVSNAGGNPVLVTQAYSYSTAFAEADLALDPATGEIVQKSAQIIPAYADVAPGTTPDPKATALLNISRALVGPAIDRVVGTAATAITRAQNEAGESALGDLVADAFRDGMHADIGFSSSGSIRADLSAGEITWGDLYAVQPFAGTVESMTLTGDQVWRALEQQWQTPPPPHNLMVSGMVYTYDAALPPGSRVTDVKINGIPLYRNATYTAAMVDFLAGGGDRYTVFTEGSNITIGGMDVDVLTSYVTLLPQPVNVTIDGRIRRIN